MLVVCCVLFSVCESLVVVRCLLLVLCWSMWGVCCRSLCVVCCSFLFLLLYLCVCFPDVCCFVVRGLLVCCSLVDVRCVRCVLCCPLFNAWCLLFGGRCL